MSLPPQQKETALPPGGDNLLTFDLMPLGPLLPLGMLMKAQEQLKKKHAIDYDNHVSYRFVED
jgi:hypothetical protein